MFPAEGGGGGGLFLPTIPIPPGDPGALSAAAGTYTAAHGEMERSRATLTRVASAGSDDSWIGVGALTFGSVSTDLVAAYGLTADALAKGATALRAYATSLTTAIATAHRANQEVALTNTTASALLSAEATARASAQAASDASQQSTTASAHATANPHSPAAANAADTAQRAATDAQQTANSDASTVSALTAQYDNERAQALKLCALAKEQAKTAATHAGSAFDSAAAGLLGNKVTAARGGAKGDVGSPWEGLTEVIEKSHASLGIIGADGILWALGRGSELATDFMKELPKVELEWLHEALPWGKDADQSVWDAAYHGWAAKADAAETFGQQFVDDTALLGRISQWGRVGGGVIAVAGDVITIVNPPQAGAMGWVDRGVAGVNGTVVGVDAVGAAGTLLGIDAISFSVPPVGVAVAVGTGLYLAGAYAYKHWAWFRDDIANPVGHAVADGAKGLVHGISDLGHDLGSLF